LKPDDYDVFDGDRGVGRIYLVHATDRAEIWFWGISFRVTKRKRYGYASTLEGPRRRSGRNTKHGREPSRAALVESCGRRSLVPGLQFPVWRSSRRILVGVSGAFPLGPPPLLRCAAQMAPAAASASPSRSSAPHQARKGRLASDALGFRFHPSRGNLKK
jgi:hypothetical protein